MGEFTHMMRNPIKERDDRIKALEQLLLRAHHSLVAGFVGGEWSSSVQSQSPGAEKEYSEARETVSEIRKCLRLESTRSATTSPESPNGDTED